MLSAMQEILKTKGCVQDKWIQQSGKHYWQNVVQIPAICGEHYCQYTARKIQNNNRHKKQFL